MAKRKKHRLWLPNRLFLGGIWRVMKTVGYISRVVSRNACSVLRQRVSPAVARKVGAVKGNGRKSQLVYDAPVPDSTLAGSFDEFSRSLLRRSQIVLIFGRRGSGKSALGFRLMENISAKSGKPCFVLGVKQKLLPSWISEIEDLGEVKDGGVVLVDEGAISFGSRESMQKKNVALGKMLATARHKDLTLFFITQNTSMIDKNVLSLTDVILAKEGSLLQKQMERPVTRELMAKVVDAMKPVPKYERVRRVYIFSDDFEGLCTVPLPSFWTQDISKNQA